MRAAFLAIVVASTSGCVFMQPPDEPDGGVSREPPASDAAGPGGEVGAEIDAGLVPDPSVALSDVPAPRPDDPVACHGIGTAPDLEPAPDRPCTEESPEGMTTFRYAGDRMVFQSDRTTNGSESVYTSEDVGDTRVETVEMNGRVRTRDVTLLKEGRPIEADHLTAAADGGLELNGHSSWTYDAAGRKES